MRLHPSAIVQLEFAGLDALLGYRLRRAQGAAHRLYMTHVAELDLTQKQTAVLWLAHSNPGVAQIRLAEALSMDRATTMAVVDRLEARGFLRRSPSREDRRRQDLLVTAAGRRMLQRVQRRIAQIERRYEEFFTPAERRQLTRLLTRVQQASDPERGK